MKKVHVLSHILCVAVFLGASCVLARPSVEEREIQKEIPVYKSPLSSIPLFTLSPGQKVLVSTKNIKGFYRVKLVGDFKKRGYVWIEDLNTPVSANDLTKPSKRKGPVFTPKPKKEGGILLFGPSLAGAFQGESELNAGEGQIFTVSSFTSLGYGANIAWDRSFAGDWRIRFFFKYRLLEMNGHAGLEVDDTTSDKVVREQSLLGLGMLFRTYLNTGSPWWWGLSGEVAKLGKSVTTIADANPVKSDVSGAPLRYLVLAHLGWDWMISPTWRLVPDIGVGAIANLRPITFFAEATLNAAVSF